MSVLKSSYQWRRLSSLRYSGAGEDARPYDHFHDLRVGLSPMNNCGEKKGKFAAETQRIRREFYD